MFVNLLGHISPHYLYAVLDSSAVKTKGLLKIMQMSVTFIQLDCTDGMTRTTHRSSQTINSNAVYLHVTTMTNNLRPLSYIHHGRRQREIRLKLAGWKLRRRLIAETRDGPWVI